MLTIGGTTFSVAATLVWNSLPEVFRSSSSLALFRKSLNEDGIDRESGSRRQFISGRKVHDP